MAEGLNTDVIDALITLKVKELQDSWIPIDENTPKDRPVWLFNGVKVLAQWDKLWFMPTLIPKLLWRKFKSNLNWTINGFRIVR